MAEQFLEEIYQYANTITKAKITVEHIRKFQMNLSEDMFESLMLEMYKLCEKSIETGFIEAEELFDQIKTLNNIEDEILLGDILENVIVPMMERWIQSVSQICQQVDEKYVLESTASGFLTIKNIRKNKYLHSNNNPLEEAGKLVECLYNSSKKSYSVYGCGLGYHAYALYLISNGDINIKIYESDSSIVEYARRYGVLDWIPSDRLEIVIDKGGNLFIESIYADNKGTIIYKPSAYCVENEEERERLLDLFEVQNSINRLNLKIGFLGNSNYNVLSEKIYLLREITEKEYLKEVITQIYKTEVDDFLNFLKKYEKNIYKYIYVLSVLYEITNRELILLNIMEALKNSRLESLYIENIRKYIFARIFVNANIHISYIQEREINKQLCDKWKEEWGKCFNCIPYENRNKDTILIMTDQLLSIKHAPTAIVMNTVVILNSLGYKVSLLVNINSYDIKTISNICFNPYVMNVNEGLYLINVLEYKGIKIPFMQVNYTQNTKDVIERVKKFIFNINPEFIWHIGGQSFIADIIGESSTYIATKCTDGYAASEADVLASYMVSDSKYVKESLEYINTKNQLTCKFISPIAGDYEVSTDNYTREQFGLPENKFLICFVGNRLGCEIDSKYIEWMKELLETSDEFFFVTIGSKIEESEFKDNVKQLGYQSELSSVLKVCNIFVNPPRQGGGGGAVAALAAGIPALTLPGCDVANGVPNEFIFDDLEKIKREILKCSREYTYYMDMCEKARAQYEKLINESKKENMQKVLREMFHVVREREKNV